MIDIYEYITLPKSKRQKHLRLKEPCIERGGDWRICRGILAFVLNTTVPSGFKINVCHACNNRDCSNPKHLYWGTVKENLDDSGMNCWERSVVKHGLDAMKSKIRSHEWTPEMLKKRTATIRKNNGGKY